jgi:hypothetical protein
MSNQPATVLSVKELKAALDKLEVAYKKKANREQLQELLNGAEDRKGLGEDPRNTPFCEIFSSPKARHPVCLACIKEFGKRYDACQELAEEAKANKGADKASGPSSKVKGKYADFGELKKSLENAPEKRLTMVVDKALLAGATMKDLLAEVEERKTTDFKDSKDFPTTGRIQAHVKFRASKGWVFTVFKNGKVKLTGYEQEPQTVSFTKPVDEKDEEEAKAA